MIKAKLPNQNFDSSKFSSASFFVETVLSFHVYLGTCALHVIYLVLGLVFVNLGS